MIYKIRYGSDALPLKIGALSIQCYILDNNQAVLDKKSVQKALGYDGKSEDWLLDLLGSINKFYPIAGNLFDAFEHPLLFEKFDNDGTSDVAKGITPEILLQTCQTILNAKNDGYLNMQQVKHARAAETIFQHLNKSDLEQMMETATGFTFLKETGKNHLQAYMLSHTGDSFWNWIATIDDAFFEILLELNALEWPSLKNNPAAVGALLHEMVYSRLKPELREILRNQKPKRAYRKKDFTLPNNIHPELGAYLAEVVSLSKVAIGNSTVFMQLLNRMHPQNSASNDLLKSYGDDGPVILSDWEVTLKKGLETNRIYTRRK